LSAARTTGPLCATDRGVRGHTAHVGGVAQRRGL